MDILSCSFYSWAQKIIKGLPLFSELPIIKIKN